MDHDNLKLKLFEFIDGELSGAEAAGMASHLEACPDCRADADLWMSVRQNFKSGFDLSPSYGFADRVLNRIRANSEKRSFLADWLGLPRWEILASAASLLMVLSYFLADQAQ